MRTNTMKRLVWFAGLLLLVTRAGAAEGDPFDLTIDEGPRRGERFRVVKSEVFPRSVAPATNAPMVKVLVGSQETNVSVCWTAVVHECVLTSGGRDRPSACFELQVRAVDLPQFEWSCWTPDVFRPHSLRVVTLESGLSYVCYVREGIHLFRLSQSRPSASMLREFRRDLSDRHHPDALPVLASVVLKESLGWTNMVGRLGPQAWSVWVDKVSDKGGELQVTVRGVAPKPLCTYALIEGKWVLVKTEN